MIQKNADRQKVAVALSGGVDSAVAAFLLKKQNATMRGVFMRNWRDDPQAGCHDKEDLIAATAVADQLGIDLEVVNFEQAYQKHVFQPFLRALQQGLTPNPDVLCNRYIKFSMLLDHVLAAGDDQLATGHYACNVHPITAQLGLYSSEGGLKDQTYFLHQITLAQLARTCFPLASLCKSEVKALARAAHFDNWSRKESTGLCFVGERHFPSFLSRYIAHSVGDMVEEDTGCVVGQHRGLAFYTIGQRRGLGLGGRGPWFVARKEQSKNLLMVVRGADHPSLWSSVVHIRQVHWIEETVPNIGWVYAARLRHRQPLASCTLTAADEREATIIFAAAQWAPTPGQYAVLYDGKRCLGGGTII